MKTVAIFGLCLGLAGALAGLTPARAAEAPRDMKALNTPTDKLVLHRKDVPQVTVFVWEQDGVKHEAGPGGAEKPPKGATELRLRTFPFPDGTMREVEYQKGARVPGATSTDVTAYLVSGHIVETVNGVAHDLRAGDAFFLPAGVKDLKEAQEPSTMALFYFPANGAPAAEPVFLSGKDVPVFTGAEWATGDENHAALTPDAIAKAPPEARKFYLRTFKFPRWGIVESHIETGLTSGWHGGAAPNGMSYLVSGREIVHYRSGVDEEILPGDMFREPPGDEHRTETPEAVFLVRGAVPESFKVGR